MAMVAGEASGDLLAGLLLDGLQTRWPGLSAHGIGGPRMVSKGFDAWWPSEKLAVRGYMEVLRHYREIVTIRERLKERLLKDKQVLELARPAQPGGIVAKDIKGVVVDDEAATRTGFAGVSTSVGPFVGTGYRHDGGEKDGKQSATFTPDLPAAGKYEVRLSYSPNPNRATNVPVAVKHVDGEKALSVNQRQKPTTDGAFVSLGTFAFEKGKSGSVTVTNKDVDGYVIIDAVVWVPAK